MLWIQPAFVETFEAEANVNQHLPNPLPPPGSPNDAPIGPAHRVDWNKPNAQDIDHQDHRRVHVTLMAQHLDIAHEHNRLGNGVQVIGHVDAADKHNNAAEFHRKADSDPDFIQGAIAASRAAYKKTRSLIRRIKPQNMTPKALQPTEEAKQAVKELATLKAELAPEALEVRQDRRLRGKDPL